MILSKYTLKNIAQDRVSLPEEALFTLPERVLQFGTGVLLRGLPDYFIDKANRQGIFNGRIVVVKSTTHGDTSEFDKQDNLYTLCIRGVQEGEQVEENIVNASISRVLSSHNQWEAILECAYNPDMNIIISNTTEVGIQLVHDDIRKHPPVSFPGKLLAFLYERFKAFGGSAATGMVIVPTELIPDNGKKLEAIVLELAHLNNLEESFIEWLEQHNYFCNSLVDRIVPGKPEGDAFATLQEELGYKDALLSMSEVYRLWAIEGSAAVKEVLSFAKADEGVVIEPDIDLYRELKLRLLNGTHSLSCGVAFLSGIKTVKEAMDDEAVSAYIESVMKEELAPAIPYKIDRDTAMKFGNKVLDRFRNPSIRHFWINITMQYSSKLNMRVVPCLLQHYKNSNEAPPLMALGFAAYLYFTKPVKQADGKYYGNFEGEDYVINDDQASVFYSRWQAGTPATVVAETLSDTGFWGDNLSVLPGFSEAVLKNLERLESQGMKAVLKNAIAEKADA